MSFYLQNENLGVEEEQGISWVVHLESAENITTNENRTNFRRFNYSSNHMDVTFTDVCGIDLENNINNNREYEAISETRENSTRILFAIFFNAILLILILGLFISVLIQLIRDWENTCDRNLKIWCIVWLARFLLTSIIRSITTIITKAFERPIPLALIVFVNILYVFGVGWWFYGINIIYTSPPTQECRKNYSIALFLFWFQFIQIFVPILLPIILCILILYVLHRNGVQTERKTVPEDMLCKIQAISFIDHIESLRKNNTNVSIFNENQINVEVSPTEEPPNLNNSVTSLKMNEPILGKERCITINKSCPICVQEIDDNAIIRILPCDIRHIFHKECIDGWFKQNCVCPICRSDILRLIKDSPD